MKRQYPQRDGLTFEQVAVSDNAGDRYLYYVSESTIRETGLPLKVQGMSSLKKSHVLLHVEGAKPYFGLTDHADTYISREITRCETLSTVLSRNNVDRIDLFVVDAEGCDYEIMRQIDFSRFLPKLILYEHANLGDETHAAAKLLLSHGYRIANCGYLDTIAVLPRSIRSR